MSLSKEKTIALSVSFSIVFLVLLGVFIVLKIKKNKQKEVQEQGRETSQSIVSRIQQSIALKIAQQSIPDEFKPTPPEDKYGFLKSKCLENDDLKKFQKICKKNDLEDAKSLKDLRIDDKSLGDLPLLHYLALYGSSKIMEYLLKEKHIDVNQLDRYEDNALFYVAYSDKSSLDKFKSCANILIKNNIDINAINSNNENVLFRLFADSYKKERTNLLERLRFFLDAGIKIEPEKGCSALKECLLNRHRYHYMEKAEDFRPFTKVLNLLLEKDDNLKNSAIFYLLEGPPLKGDVNYTNAYIECIELVLSKRPDLNVKNNNDETALQLAEKYEKSNYRGNDKLYAEAIKSIKKHIKYTDDAVYISMLKNVFLENDIVDSGEFKEFLRKILDFVSDPNDVLLVLLDNPPTKSNRHYKCYKNEKNEKEYIKCIKIVLKRNPDLSVECENGKTSLEIAAMHESSNYCGAGKLYEQVKELIIEQSKEKSKASNDKKQKHPQPRILHPKEHNSPDTKTQVSATDDAQKNIAPLSNADNARA